MTDAAVVGTIVLLRGQVPTTLHKWHFTGALSLDEFKQAVVWMKLEL